MHLLTLVLCQRVLHTTRFPIRMHNADPPRSLSFKRLKLDLFLHFPAISSSRSSYQVSTQTGCSGLREGVAHLEALAPAVPGSQEFVTVAPSFCCKTTMGQSVDFGSQMVSRTRWEPRLVYIQRQQSEHHFHHGIHNHATCYLVETRCFVGLIYPSFTLFSIISCRRFHLSLVLVTLATQFESITNICLLHCPNMRRLAL